eukprot:jgi/Chlat1/3257/Chrsp22S03438
MAQTCATASRAVAQLAEEKRGRMRETALVRETLQEDVQRELRELRVTCAASAADVARLQEELDAVTRAHEMRLSEVREACRAKVASVRDARAQEVEKESASVQERLAEAESRVASSQAAADASLKQKAELEAEVRSLRERLHSAQRQAEASAKDAAALTDRLKRLEMERDKERKKWEKERAEEREREKERGREKEREGEGKFAAVGSAKGAVEEMMQIMETQLLKLSTSPTTQEQCAERRELHKLLEAATATSMATPKAAAKGEERKAVQLGLKTRAP